MDISKVKENDSLVTNFYHSIPIQVRFNDVDILGHVNNAMYQHYFDFGKLNYFNQVLGFEVNWDTTGLVLAKITIDYLLPIELNEAIIVHTKIIKLGNKSLEVYQEISGSNESDVKATGLSVMVGFLKPKNETILIPNEWRKMISAFEQLIF